MPSSMQVISRASCELDWEDGSCKLELSSCRPAAGRRGGSIAIVIRERYRTVSPSNQESFPQHIFYVMFEIPSICFEVMAAVCEATQPAAPLLEENVLNFLNEKVSCFAAKEGSDLAINARVEVVYTYDEAENAAFDELMESACEREEIAGFVKQMSREMGMKMARFRVGETGGGGEGGGDSCRICFGSMEEEGERMKIHCKHSFHYACIVEWLLLNKNSCPLCRSPLVRLV